MSRFTNTNVKLTLSDLRSKIRNGVVTVSYRDNPKSLWYNVAVAFGIDPDDFNTDNFNPQTYRRFGKLFAIPTFMGSSQLFARQFPSQDETATALQNFINRRSDPWSHVRKLTIPEQLATDVPQFPESV